MLSIVLKNFWYALEFSRAVRRNGRPVPLTVMGNDLVFVRDRAGVVTTYNRRRSRDEVLPTQERYGFVWAYLGDPDVPERERPPLPTWPEWDDPAYGGHRATGEWTWQANVERVLENGVDIAHAPFVHKGAFGNPERPEVQDYEVALSPWSAEATVTLHPPAPRGRWSKGAQSDLDLKDRPGVVTSTAWFLPSLIRLRVQLPIGTLCLYDTNIPVSQEVTLTKFITLRTFFTGRWADRNAVKRTYPIFEQDSAIVENQRPSLLPFDLSAELHVRSDSMALAYRKRRAALHEAGWEAAPDAEFVGGSPRALSA